ncbi:hypothetical protein DVH24_032578 [Malus domestica]|uniref:Uncharacterized protein n=1 Tax=Malus domestica TaxID=3750 RepID=A0A498J9Z5_MALDO|nr:hypothetical protein DVH24_032578 [Malus domestica]
MDRNQNSGETVVDGPEKMSVGAVNENMNMVAVAEEVQNRGGGVITSPEKDVQVPAKQDGVLVESQDSLQQMDNLSSDGIALNGYYGAQQNVHGLVQLNLMEPPHDSYYVNQQSMQGLGQLNSIAPNHDGFFGAQQSIHGMGQLDFRPSSSFSYSLQRDLELLSCEQDQLAIRSDKDVNIVDVTDEINVDAEPSSPIASDRVKEVDGFSAEVSVMSDKDVNVVDAPYEIIVEVNVSSQTTGGHFKEVDGLNAEQSVVSDRDVDIVDVNDEINVDKEHVSSPTSDRVKEVDGLNADKSVESDKDVDIVDITEQCVSSLNDQSDLNNVGELMKSRAHEIDNCHVPQQESERNNAIRVWQPRGDPCRTKTFIDLDVSKTECKHFLLISFRDMFIRYQQLQPKFQSTERAWLF